MDEQRLGARRLLIVSNRLPFTIVETNGELTFTESSGGLVTGLGAYLDSLRVNSPDTDYVWVGWPGSSIDEQHLERLKSLALEEFHAYPVSLTEEEMDKFYFGFCNDTIWPLFHYFPTYAKYDEEYWQTYKKVNEIFADALLEVIKPGDVVWVHDYQLMLLPGMIRERMPDVTIGFFLHIPFPSFEMFRLLPRQWSAQILKGLLGSDLIGFHTYDYTQYFLRAVMRILGHEHNTGQIITGDRIVKASTFPMGIDYDKYANATREEAVRAEREQLLQRFEETKIVLSIDRLDYTKGVINRLYGYEIFLRQNPQWHKKVVLALVVIPSRTGVERYQETREHIEELVGHINGQFGSLDWTPVIYQYRSLPFETLIALYSSSQIAMVTPLRDGMNLVAKEYIATHEEHLGVLILSEMAGAAKELVEAIIINPNSRQEIADAIREALEMSEEEQRRTNTVMQERLRRHNVVAWAESFMTELTDMKEVQDKFRSRVMSESTENRLAHDYAKAERRLLFLDYDGTLAPFTRDPQAAAPSDEILYLLRTLGANPRNEVVLISGRDRATLTKWFGDLGINLVAEHGVWIRRTGTEWSIVRELSNAWKERVRPVLQAYVDRLPGAFIEEKDFSIAWHYRATDADLGPLLAKELHDQLVSFTANIDVQVLQGNKVIEVKSAGISKGTTGLQWLAQKQYDFVLSIGDDWTDEHLFMVLPESAYSIRVGITQSYARYNVRDHHEVLRLIGRLCL